MGRQGRTVSVKAHAIEGSSTARSNTSLFERTANISIAAACEPASYAAKTTSWRSVAVPLHPVPVAVPEPLRYPF